MDESPPKLRAIDGGRRDRPDGIDLVLAPAQRAPFPVDAIVLEEDTYMVLSARPEVPPVADHPIRVMTAVLDVEPHELGVVIVRPGRPTRLLAVVHDLDREPSTTVACLRRALREALAAAGRLRARAIRLPLVGSELGGLDPSQSLSLIDEALAERAPETLRRVWIVEPS